MADQTTVHIGENSPEQVAFKLMQLIGSAENKPLHHATPAVSREWILTTYAQCLLTVKTPHLLGNHLAASTHLK